MVFFGRNIKWVTRVHQTHRPQQRDLRRMHAYHLTAHAAQALPLGFGTQTTAVKNPVGLTCDAGRKIFW